MNLKNLIRVGKVSSINYPAGRLRVVFEDKDGIVTDELPMLNFEYEMPNVGEPVLCLFLGNGITKGFVLGRYFYASDPPVEGGYGQDIYYKRFLKDAAQKYDRVAKTMTWKAQEFVFDGNVTITGNLKVNGNINVDGNINAGGDIESGGNINASENIKAVNNIRADGTITAAGAITPFIP
jgi:phage baseplate assembly protein gpV